jgi:hypothetical protein
MARRRLGSFALGYANPASWRDCPHADSRTSARRLPIFL